MHHSKQAAITFAEKHNTNDPRQLAAALNIPVEYEPLGEVLGYYTCYKRMPSIHINSEAEQHQQIFALAHELGHHILHPKVNTPFLRKNTLLSVDRIEREANEFAVALMLYGANAEEGESAEAYCARYGVPREMVRYV